jgi:cation diffusion facilitator CzcD-associated flavoprotein CzcO
MATNGTIEEADIVVVGAGFSGVYLLYRLRSLGYKVVACERGSDLGGTWYWNAYPGARVDTLVPFYEYSMKEVWKGWTWSELYPGRDELRRYFDHVDKILDVKKDIRFNTTVTEAEFDESHNQWTVRTDTGSVIGARFFVVCSGFASERYVPDIPGLETFKGQCCHTSRWPQGGVDLKRKRVGVIGTGATGVQVIQEIGPITERLTVFQRTPNQAIPMGQRKLDAKFQETAKNGYPDLYKLAKQTFAGYDYEPLTKNMFEDPEDVRQKFIEHLWNQGGFKIWLGNYGDLLKNQEANNVVYKLWRDKTRPRLTKDDPELIENLVPELPLHPFGTKRPCLEQKYYEVYNLPSVELVNIKKTPIIEVTPNGVKTSTKEYELDVLILATGFDFKSALLHIDIRGVNGASLRKKWANGNWTYLGMTTSGFPNLFWTYGVQGPTSFANGPTAAEIQGDWIVKCIQDMDRQGHRRIDPTPEAEAGWRKHIIDMMEDSLFPKADSWYMGANIPGRPREPQYYLAGLPKYQEECRRCVEQGYAGFVLA